MQASGTILGPVSWERIRKGIGKVKDRLWRATAALDHARIEYAVIGGNAVAAWVSRADDSVVRNTPDVDVLVRREDLVGIVSTMEVAGFVRNGSATFLESSSAKPREIVRFVMAKEHAMFDSPELAPDVTEIDRTFPDFRLINLSALVTMKLTAHRRIDRVHLRDMIEIGQLDASWLDRVPSSFRQRLQDLLDDPDG